MMVSQVISTVTDPICCTDLQTNQVAVTYAYMGQTYSFCSVECRDLFAHSPEECVICLAHEPKWCMGLRCHFPRSTNS